MQDPLGPMGDPLGPWETNLEPFLGPDPTWTQMLFSDKQKTENCIFRLDFHFYMFIILFGVHTVKDLAELV